MGKNTLKKIAINILLACVAAFFAMPARAQTGADLRQKRFISINLCTDQLLLALAYPEQIIGLSPFARDVVRSENAVSANQFPVLSGTAEEVIIAKPDLVLSGRFTKRSTLEFIKNQNIPVAEFDSVRSIAESREQITRMGRLTGHPERAATLVARIDSNLEKAKAAASHAKLRVLPVQRRGWVTGQDTLMTSLLETVGLVNAGAEIAGKAGKLASLESIVALKADIILTSRLDGAAEDQGRAFLLHPALRSSIPTQLVITVPERMTVCGGPAIADALDHIALEITRIGLK